MQIKKIFPGKKEIWTRKLRILYGCLNLLQLVISLLNYDNIVWIANWYSAVLITKGVPMYAQYGYTVRTISLPPDHFPLYFYFLALVIIIFGNNQIMGRIITWLFVWLTGHLLIEIIQPRDQIELSLIMVLYYLDPLLVSINYYGKQDQFTMFFNILGIYYVTKSHYNLAAVSFSLGTLVKFFPIFFLIATGVYLLQRKEYASLLNYIVISISVIGGIVGYNLFRWGDRFTHVILFQINRLTPSLSLFYYIIPQSVTGNSLLVYQFVFYLSIFILLLLRDIGSNYVNVLIMASMLAATYLVPNRQYYSTYAYFVFMPLIPLTIDLHRQRQYKLIFILLLNYIILFQGGNILCYNTCYPQINPFSILSMIGIYFVFISTLLILPYDYFILYYREKNINSSEPIQDK